MRVVNVERTAKTSTNVTPLSRKCRTVLTVASVVVGDMVVGVAAGVNAGERCRSKLHDDESS